MNSFVKAAAFVAAIAGLLTNASCKKQEESTPNIKCAQTEQSVSASEQKVLDFIEAYTEMKHGAKIEGEAVTPEEARWQWETTLNYCYGFTQDQLTEMREDTVHVAMPKANTQGSIAYSDMLTTYNEIVNAVRETYKAIDMENKTLKFVMVSLDDQAKDGNVTIVMNTGKNTNSTDPQGPFGEGECYTWGTIGTTENPTYAPMKIYEAICDYDDSMTIYYNPCSSCVTWIDSITETKYYGFAENNDSLFHATELTWAEVQNYLLCHDDLNKEYYYIIKRGHYGQPTNLYEQKWYYCSKVYSQGKQIALNSWDIWHWFIVKTCIRHWRHDGGLYPIPIDEDE